MGGRDSQDSLVHLLTSRGRRLDMQQMSREIACVCQGVFKGFLLLLYEEETVFHLLRCNFDSAYSTQVPLSLLIGFTMLFLWWVFL